MKASAGGPPRVRAHTYMCMDTRPCYFVALGSEVINGSIASCVDSIVHAHIVDVVVDHILCSSSSSSSSSKQQ